MAVPEITDKDRPALLPTQFDDLLPLDAAGASWKTISEVAELCATLGTVRIILLGMARHAA